MTGAREHPGRRRTVAVLMAVGASLAAFVGGVRRAPADHTAFRDEAATNATVCSHTTFPFHAPSDAGLRILEPFVELSGRAPWGGVHYMAPDGGFIDLVEGIQRRPPLIRAQTSGHAPVGVVRVRGRTWFRYRNEEPILARTLDDGVSVIVRGAPWNDLAHVAGTIADRPACWRAGGIRPA